MISRDVIAISKSTVEITSGEYGIYTKDYDNLDEYGEPKKKPIKPMMYTDIATEHEYSSTNTAHKNAKRRLQN